MQKRPRRRDASKGLTASRQQATPRTLEEQRQKLAYFALYDYLIELGRKYHPVGQ
jgi:hypothetical protein